MGLKEEVLLGAIEPDRVVAKVEVRNEHEDFTHRPSRSKIYFDARPHMRPKDFLNPDNIHKQITNQREVRNHLPKITLNVDMNKTLSPKPYKQ